MWLTCSGHWEPELGHHVCYFADTTSVELSRLQAQSVTESIHQVFEHLPVMVAYFGLRPMGVCLFANRQFAEIFGLDEKSIVGFSILKVVSKSLIDEVNPHVKRLLDERTPVTFTCQITSAAGVPMRFEVNLSLATRSWPTNAEPGLFFLLTDITERYKACLLYTSDAADE